MEFRVNKNITLRLEDGITNIYVGNELFRQCKFLLLVGKGKNMLNNNDLTSIDDAVEKLDTLLEGTKAMSEIISPEVEFWGHCSNIQGWAECDYDSHFLHANMAFPLLKRLKELGDSQAKKIFAEEIVNRYMEGNKTVRTYLIEEGFLNDLTPEERAFILKNESSIIIEMERFISDRIDIVGNVKLAGKGFQLSDDKIIALRLDGKEQHRFPPQIKLLKSLKTLILRGFLDKDVPEWIGDLQNLEYLDLCDSQLETLPKTIGKLRNLVRLDLSRNKLVNLPKEIVGLKNLEYFDMADNRLIIFPIELCELTKLVSLGLGKNEINKIPSSIEKLINLRDIYLVNNPLRTLPKELLELPKIEFIGKPF